MTLTLLKVREMDKWLMGRSVINEMKEQLAKFVHSKKTAPDGWVAIQDPIGTVYGRSDKGELVVRGRYYAPREAADLLNNHLSPGLRGKAIYDAYMWIGNSLNQLQLALPGFHAATRAVNAVASKQALALEALARGEVKEGLKALARSPFAPVTDIVTGEQLLKGYRADVPGDPEIAAMVDHIVQAGGRASLDPLYKNDTWKNFTTALRSGNYPGAAFADLARLEMRRLARDASPTDVRGAMQKAWDSVDNRFGQVVYDNLFLNRVLKDVLHASVRSVGWNLGTLRELGGGIYDLTLPQFRRHAGDGPGERAEPRLSHRTAFLVSMSVTTGLMAAVYQFLHTGQLPQGPKDLVFPRTGDTAPDGSEQRVSMPGYLKDAYALTAKPLQTAEHKLHPFLSLIAQSAENVDYYGVEIRHKDDPLVEQLRDYVAYLAKEMTPIALQSASKRRQEGSGWKGTLESQLGISPAPRNVVSPPTEAEELAREYLGPPDVRTKEQEAKRQDGLRYREAVRNQDAAAASAVAKAGRLTDTRLREIQSTAGLTALQANFRRLTVEQAFHVYEVATPVERGALMPLLERKLQNAEIAPADFARLQRRLRPRPRFKRRGSASRPCRSQRRLRRPPVHDRARVLPSPRVRRCRHEALRPQRDDILDLRGGKFFRLAAPPTLRFIAIYLLGPFFAAWESCPVRWVSPLPCRDARAEFVRCAAHELLADVCGDEATRDTALEAFAADNGLSADGLLTNVAGDRLARMGVRIPADAAGAVRAASRAVRWRLLCEAIELERMTDRLNQRFASAEPIEPQSSGPS